MAMKTSNIWQSSLINIETKTFSKEVRHAIKNFGKCRRETDRQTDRQTVINMVVSWAFIKKIILICIGYCQKTVQKNHWPKNVAN